VSATIDRMHYYERQYLRSFDLTAEQLYHIEMRRRLNLALHLWGIVDGLDLQKSATNLGLPQAFHISRGMAIDAFGREIVLPIDYPLTSDDLERNLIRFPNLTYFVSILYRRDLATPPSGGYRVCDIKDQYTRWRESFDIRITEKNPGLPPVPPPGVADALSDDPLADPWPIVLGTIKTGLDIDGKLSITLANAEQRTYAGLRAQRVITPASSVSPTQSNPAQTVLPFVVGADLLIEQNAFVGRDFEITNASGNGQEPPDPTKATPPATGVLKVADDMFLNGDFFANIGGEWLTMKDYLQTFIPEVKVGRLTVPVTPIATSTGDDPTTDVILLDVETRLRKPKEQTLMVALTSIVWQSRNQEATWVATSDATALIKLTVKDPGAATELTPSKYQFKIEWEVEPTSSGATPQVPVREFTLSWVAVFNP
jgi:hypothetical protein